MTTNPEEKKPETSPILPADEVPGAIIVGVIVASAFVAGVILGRSRRRGTER